MATSVAAHTGIKHLRALRSPFFFFSYRLPFGNFQCDSAAVLPFTSQVLKERFVSPNTRQAAYQLETSHLLVFPAPQTEHLYSVFSLHI